MKPCRVIFWLVLAALPAALALGAPPCSAEARRVLAVHSYHPGFTWQRDLDATLDQVLAAGPPPVEVFHEYLDTLRLPDPAHQVEFFRYLKAKYKDAPPALILASDNDALNFLLNYRDWLCGPVPVVFMGVNDFRPALLRGEPNYTGVAEDVDLASTLRVALALRPQTRRVVVFAAHTLTFFANQQLLRRAIQEVEPGLKLDARVGLPLSKVLEQAARLEPGDIVLAISPIADDQGHMMLATDFTPPLARASTVPLFGAWDFLLGRGIVGGRLVSARAQAALAADMALKILQGANPASLPVVTHSPNQYMFDHAEMARFGLPLGKLPPGSLVINRPVPLMERYLHLVLGVLAAFAGLLIVIGLLYANVRRRQRAEQSLRQSQESYRRIVETAEEGVWSIDGDFNTNFVNQKMASMLGYAPEEMLGRSLPSFMPAEELPDHAKKMKLRQAGHAQRYERRLLRKDGQGVWTQVSATPVFDQQGRFAGAFAMYTDITQRKRMEQALIESEQRLQTMLDNLPAGVVLRMGDGERLHINRTAERFLGYNREEIASLDLWFAKLHGQRSADVRRLYEADRRAGFPARRVVEVRRADGEPRQLEFQGHEFGAGEVWLVSDVTEREQAAQERQRLEDRLRQAQKLEALGTLAGGIAHDFNNILAAIMGFAELISCELDSQGPTVQHLDQLLTAAERAKHLVRQILSFSRPSDQAQQPVEMAAVVGEAFHLLRASLPSTIALALKTETEPSLVMADPTQIHQVILNLGTNAGQAMSGRGGHLTLRVRRAGLPSRDPDAPDLPPGEYVCLEVSDDGPGMDQDTLARIFEPFFTTKTGGSGSGMGLAVVHGIVKAHHGAVTVRSQPGQGSHFRVWLPRLDQPGLTVAAPAPACAEPQGRERILFVDDEPLLVDLGRRTLGGLGYRVTALSSSQEALAILQDQDLSLDLLITDQTMPAITGTDLIQSARRIRPGLPAILCTGYAENLDPALVARLGLGQVLIKPIHRQELAQAVRQVLDRRGS